MARYLYLLFPFSNKKVTIVSIRLFLSFKIISNAYASDHVLFQQKMLNVLCVDYV